MALKKNKLMYGKDCSYWKITGVSEDRITNTSTCFISLYVDEFSRRQDINSFIDVQAYSFTGIKFTDKELYDMIKQQQDFLNSEDV
jgi:hypothetical protein